MTIYTPETATKKIHQHVLSVETTIQLLEDVSSLRIDLEQISRISSNVAEDLPRIRSLLDEKIQHVHEMMNELRTKGLFLKEHPRKMGLFYVDLIGVFNGKLAWLCWELGETSVQHYHRWQEGCSQRVLMTSTELKSWERSISELTFFISSE